MSLVIAIVLGLLSGLVPGCNAAVIVSAGNRLPIEPTEALAFILVVEAISSHLKCIGRSMASSEVRIAAYWFGKVVLLVMTLVLVSMDSSLFKSLYLIGPLTGMIMVLEFQLRRGMQVVPIIVLCGLVSWGIIYNNRIDLIMWLGIGMGLFRVPYHTKEILPEGNPGLDGALIGVVAGTSWGASLNILTESVVDRSTSYKRLVTEELARGACDGMIILTLLTRGSGRLDIQDLIDLTKFNFDKSAALGGALFALFLAVLAVGSIRYTRRILIAKIIADRFWLYKSIATCVAAFFILGPVALGIMLSLRIADSISNQRITGLIGSISPAIAATGLA